MSSLVSQIENFEQLALPLFASLDNLAFWFAGDQTEQKTWCRKPSPKQYERLNRLRVALFQGLDL